MSTCCVTRKIKQNKESLTNYSKVCYFSIGAPPQVKIMDDGFDIAGQVYSLVCEVEVIAGSPTVSWVHNGSEVTAGELTGIGTTNVTLTLTFTSLMYEDRGEYTCVGFSNISSPDTANETFTINVHGKHALLHFLFVNCVLFLFILSVEYSIVCLSRS